MEKAYAQALWMVIKKGMKPSGAIRAMHEKLTREGRAALMPRIAWAFDHIARRDANRTALTLTVADEAHAPRAHKEASHAGLDLERVENRVDTTLIGGWRLEGQEQLIDASYKRHLLAIYRAATHA
ncbi:MAG TPA: F0F1 ATP synthase subunit delta [Candidatus Paceibacterota bacterium]|nr:F0F1 ATP synthase subunit delta [Candidatus Paceibacterota bacterium]